MKAKQIIMEGISGYCPEQFVYYDKLIITPRSIAYEFEPSPKGFKISRKWLYTTTSLSFGRGFDRVADAVDLLLQGPCYLEHDSATVCFSVTYMDGSTAGEMYCGLPGQFDDCFQKIKDMLPPVEEPPESIKLYFERRKL